jgi:hypothetical protein
VQGRLERSLRIGWLESARDQAQGLLSTFDERDVFEPALDLAPLAALQGAGTTHVVIEGHVLQRHEESGQPLVSDAALCEFLKYKEVVLRNIACEVFKVLAELIDHYEDWRALAEGLEGEADCARGTVSASMYERAFHAGRHAGAPVGMCAASEGAGNRFADRFALCGGCRSDEPSACHAEGAPARLDQSQQPRLGSPECILSIYAYLVTIGAEERMHEEREA